MRYITISETSSPRWDTVVQDMGSNDLNRGYFPAMQKSILRGNGCISQVTLFLTSTSEAAFCLGNTNPVKKELHLIGSMAAGQRPLLRD